MMIGCSSRDNKKRRAYNESSNNDKNYNEEEDDDDRIKGKNEYDATSTNNNNHPQATTTTTTTTTTTKKKGSENNEIINNSKSLYMMSQKEQRRQKFLNKKRKQQQPQQQQQQNHEQQQPPDRGAGFLFLVSLPLQSKYDWFFRQNHLWVTWITKEDVERIKIIMMNNNNNKSNNNNNGNNNKNDQNNNHKNNSNNNYMIETNKNNNDNKIVQSNSNNDDNDNYNNRKIDDGEQQQQQQQQQKYLIRLLEPYFNLQDSKEKTKNQKQQQDQEQFFIAEGTETVRLLIQHHIKQQQQIEQPSWSIQLQSIFVKPNLLLDEPVQLLKDINQHYLLCNKNNTDNNESNNNNKNDNGIMRPTFHVFVGTEEVLSLVAGFPITRGSLACGRIPHISINNNNDNNNEKWLYHYLQNIIQMKKQNNSSRTNCNNCCYIRLVALDGICDNANLGSIIRCSSAFGIDVILLSNNCCNVWYRKTIRVCMGHITRVPCIRVSNLSNILLSFQHHPYNITSYAAVIDPKADIILQQYPRDSVLNWCCVLGNEGNGISQQVIKSCSHTIRISMEDGVDSLSVPIAAGILLHGLKERERHG